MPSNTGSPALRMSRAMPLLQGRALEHEKSGRHCAADGCATILSRYNPAPTCAVHAGWCEQPATRRRRRSNDT